MVGAIVEGVGVGCDVARVGSKVGSKVGSRLVGGAEGDPETGKVVGAEEVEEGKDGEAVLLLLVAFMGSGISVLTKLGLTCCRNEDCW